jgi:hypothetical protein
MVGIAHNARSKSTIASKASLCRSHSLTPDAPPRASGAGEEGLILEECQRATACPSRSAESGMMPRVRRLTASKARVFRRASHLALLMPWTVAALFGCGIQPADGREEETARPTGTHTRTSTRRGRGRSELPGGCEIARKDEKSVKAAPTGSDPFTVDNASRRSRPRPPPLINSRAAI